MSEQHSSHEPDMVRVERSVLLDLLALSSSVAPLPEDRERLWQWYEEVESGERGSLTAAAFAGSGG